MNRKLATFTQQMLLWHRKYDTSAPMNHRCPDATVYEHVTGSDMADCVVLESVRVLTAPQNRIVVCFRATDKNQERSLEIRNHRYFKGVARQALGEMGIDLQACFSEDREMSRQRWTDFKFVFRQKRSFSDDAIAFMLRFFGRVGVADMEGECGYRSCWNHYSCDYVRPPANYGADGWIRYDSWLKIRRCGRTRPDEFRTHQPVSTTGLFDAHSTADGM